MATKYDNERINKPTAWKNMKKAIGDQFGIADLMVDIEELFDTQEKGTQVSPRNEMSFALWHWLHGLNREERERARRAKAFSEDCAKYVREVRLNLSTKLRWDDSLKKRGHSPGFKLTFRADGSIKLVRAHPDWTSYSSCYNFVNEIKRIVEIRELHRREQDEFQEIMTKIMEQ